MGGPKLTVKDVERIKQAGYDAKDFLEPVLNSEFKGSSIMRGSLKNKEDGSCIFLKFKVEEDRYECSIYDFRPALCRLYPFDFDRTGPNSIMLKVIPCCRGLNNPEGEMVDETMIMVKFKEIIKEFLDTGKCEKLERLKTGW